MNQTNNSTFCDDWEPVLRDMMSEMQRLGCYSFTSRYYEAIFWRTAEACTACYRDDRTHVREYRLCLKGRELVDENGCFDVSVAEDIREELWAAEPPGSTRWLR